jgi:superfamily II DNA or RNA helicase
MELRDYQKQHVEEIISSFKDFQSVLLQMPTGTGKTNVFCEIAKIFKQKYENKRILIIVHRIELVDQIINRLKLFGIKSGKVQGNSTIDSSFQIHTGTIQTLINSSKIRLFVNPSLVIVDEAHHIVARQYSELLEKVLFSNSKLLGVTATPLRLDGKGFNNIFQKLIVSSQIKEFIKLNFLCPIKHYASPIPNLNKIKVNYSVDYSFDYDEQDLNNYYSKPELIADVINTLNEFASNKKVILFVFSVQYGKMLTEKLKALNIKSIFIDAKTSKIQRNQYINEFKSSSGQFVLVNVDIFTEGFDCPDVEVVQLVKPTKSLVKYLQMVGRVTRIFENKEFGIVLDNANLWLDHGLVTNNRYWTLEGVEKEQEYDDDLIFTNGEVSSSVIKQKIKESTDIKLQLINDQELENTKIEQNLLIVEFTSFRLRNYLIKSNINLEVLLKFLQNYDIDLYDHLENCTRNKHYIYDKKISTFLKSFIDNNLSAFKYL